MSDQENETALENQKERHEIQIGELQNQLSYCKTQVSVKDAVIAQLQMEYDWDAALSFFSLA